MIHQPVADRQPLDVAAEEVLVDFEKLYFEAGYIVEDREVVGWKTGEKVALDRGIVYWVEMKAVDTEDDYRYRYVGDSDGSMDGLATKGMEDTVDAEVVAGLVLEDEMAAGDIGACTVGWVKF